MKPKDKIPKARRLLLAIADELDEIGLTRKAKRIRGAVKLMHRAKAIRKAPVSRPDPTSKECALIRDLADRHPQWTFAKIGKVAAGKGKEPFNVARVHEVLTGERK